MSLMTADLSNQIPTVLIMLGIICLVGIFGNTLVIIVYALKQDRLTATLFILVLAISDFLACVTLIPGTMIIEYLEWNIDSTFLCKFYYFINNTFIPFSSLLISCIAFDRYFCLCHPFKNILTRERAKRVILILIFICSIFGFSSTFTVRVEQVHFESNMNNNDNSVYNYNNNNRYTNTTTDHNTTRTFDYSLSLLHKNEKFECTEILKLNHTVIETVLYQIVQKSQTCSYILCILCVVTLYILIYRSVSKVFRKRLELKGVKKQDKHHAKNNTTDDKHNNKNNNNHNHTNKKNNCKFVIRNPFNFHPTNTNKSSVKIKLTSQENVSPHSELDPCIDNTVSSTSNCMKTLKKFIFKSCHTSEMKNKTSSDKETLEKFDRSQQGQLIKSNSSISINGSNLINAPHTETITVQPITFNNETHLMINEERTRRSMKIIKDNIAFQNLKTAAMLFVVAVVYIVTFIPAMLMAIQYVPLYLPIFYLYYINNAINPIIYGFMNPNFRADIHVLICQKFKCM
ncbi:unnamed protein product [Schistosoma turkestanicum]|nr:unnamed protein product [Schistosoma turkestanicum]